MKISQSRAHLPARIAAVAAALLVISTSSLRADDPKKQEEGHPQRHEQQARPHKDAPAPQREAPQREAPQVRQAPANPQPAHQPPADQGQRYGRPPQSQTVQPSGESGQRFGRQPQSQQPQQAPPQLNNRFGGQPQQNRPGASSAPVRTYAPREGVRVESVNPNRQVYHAPNGGQVHMDHGRVVEVRTANGAVIHHGPEGFRTVEVVRPGGRTVVVNNFGGGYVQRTVVISNRSYVQRTYVVNGIVTTRVYRPWVFRPGLVVNIYAPVHYYRPGLYVWAYNPWARPVYYSSWGWVGTPWFGFYAGYFAPAPYYPGPAYWLTDYLIAASLQDAYQQRLAADAAAMQAGYYNGQPGLTPEVKEAIAEEVNRQLRQEQAEAQMANAGVDSNPFAGGPHVYVADSTVEAMGGYGSCLITAGDVVELRGMPPMDATAAPVFIRAGKRGGCAPGSTVTVAIQDLAEMQNHMRELVDRGLADLQRRQGQSGLPPMPAEAAAPPTPVSWASQVKPDAGVQNEIQQASNEATRAEQETVNSTVEGAPPSGNPEPVAGASANIGIGATIDDVVAAWGLPLRTADLGGKKIYIYQNVKVIFQDGKVVDVQ
jgi:hypothetical protein